MPNSNMPLAIRESRQREFSHGLLYICGTTSLYGVRLPVNGAKTF